MIFAVSEENVLLCQLKPDIILCVLEPDMPICIVEFQTTTGRFLQSILQHSGYK